jgi:hypothetical protein
MIADIEELRPSLWHKHLPQKNSIKNVPMRSYSLSTDCPMNLRSIEPIP